MKTTKFAALGVAAALALGACGSDSDTTNSQSASASGEDVKLRLWLNGEDTPEEMIDLAVAQFNEVHPDVEVVFERQQWTGLVEKLTTSLSSNDGPDVVELGNTQAQAFEAAGALYDLTEAKEALGGDDLLQSLVEAGTYDDRFYAAPYYAGARIVVYRTDLFEQAGIEVPETMDDFVEAGIALKEANPDPGFSGIHFPGRYWYAALPFIWEAGGDIATKEGDEWAGALSSPESIEGLETVQRIITEANGAPADGDESQDHVDFCAGKAAMLMGPGWKVGQILDEADGCPEMADKIGAFALPGEEAGTTAPAFLGGSNLGVSAKSEHPDLATDLVEIMLGDEFQQEFAERGLLPARKSLLTAVEGDEATEAQATAAENSRFVPSSEHWAAVEAGTILPDMLVAIAQGADVEVEAERADEALEAALNQ